MATITNHNLATADHSAQGVLGIEGAFPEILRITEDLFGAPASVVIESDPELAEVQYAVFETTASRDSADLMRLRLQWHQRVEPIIGEDQAEKVRLSLDIDE